MSSAAALIPAGLSPFEDLIHFCVDGAFPRAFFRLEDSGTAYGTESTKLFNPAAVCLCFSATVKDR